ncbi:sensor histidine kinase [Halotia branconii]|uniref:histidine kinase n=1 Tax=Halotia branconii CENA392 TaxID=1539056 RepID=A0AAJ6PB64_9CYAN|nr:hybrid sensor histidine kinase/response regulator [Halotia branconii]WGV27491.1 ATP-binding protein [Halotia branconii CENA392]
MELERSLQRILLIEDNPNDRLLIARELRREFPDIQIQKALDWTEINQAFADDTFDFVITDYELNWTTGLDVLRAVKDHDSNRPIIMFTNSGTQEIAVEAMKAGLDDYVIKSPKHFVRLPQAVRTVWGNSQIRRKASKLEFRLQFLLNELKVGVFRTTLDGQLLEASEGLLRLLNLHSLSEAQTFFQENLMLNAIERTRQTQWQREVSLDDSGKLLWLQISETLVQLNGKTVIDGLVSNITEQKQTAAAVRSLNQTLEQRVKERTIRLEMLNRELEIFAFSVSHDLRTPIRQIDGFATLLKQQLQSITVDETVVHYLQQINELTARSGKMIDDLLQFSRTGRVEMQYTTVNMERLVQEAKRQVETQLAGRNIRWQIASLPTVRGDRNLLRQVWQNLIENAVKYTRFREQAEIAIGSGVNEGETIFFVRDNGIGFDKDEAQRLFGVFQRLANAQVFEGTGIGLANVQRVIYRHGGRLWAEGKLNVGATFYFSLPSISNF